MRCNGPYIRASQPYTPSTLHTQKKEEEKKERKNTYKNFNAMQWTIQVAGLYVWFH